MNIEVHHSHLAGKVAAIASKSQGHRIIIAAALSDKPTTININASSKDIEATLNVIDALGAEIQWLDTDKLLITPLTKAAPKAILNCSESGSTLRFLLPVAAALNGREYVFTGKGKLPKRPMEPLLSELKNHGATIKGTELPLKISGKPQGGTYSLPGNISSQFISGLLFALPLLEEDSQIIITSPRESQGYINMTLDTLKLFGVKIEEQANGYFIKGRQQYISPGTITVEGDWSNAAFWFVAAALRGEISVTGLNPHSLQGDKKILPILEAMGAEVTVADGAVTVTQSPLKALEIDAGEIPDLVPPLAVAATAAQGTTVIKNAARLRIKECDRLFAMAQTLALLGGDIQETDDGLIIKGTPKLNGGKVTGFNDHRIVMSAAVASLLSPNPVIIAGAEAVEKSYPHFFRDFQQLGGLVNVLYLR